MTAPPAGYTTAAPWIVTRDTRKLFEFITEVFDGVELGLVPLEDGSIGHAEIRLGDTVLLAFDQREGWPDMPALLRVFVADADATTQAALDAGATLVTRPLTQAFGQRGSRVREPFGNTGGRRRRSIGNCEVSRPAERRSARPVGGGRRPRRVRAPEA